MQEQQTMETVKTRSLKNDTVQIISFSIEDEVYGISLQSVLEVIRITEIQKLPKSPVFLKGIINLRGEVIPIIDLRQRFGLEEMQDNKLKRTIIVKVDDKKIGMIVDKVFKVLRITENEVKPAVNFSSMISNNYVTGIVMNQGNMIILVDIENVFSEREIDEFRKLHDQMQNIEQDN